MTEKEFMKEVWRPYDVVTLEGDGLIKARVQNVCFTTRSVRIKLPGDQMPEWFRCELIAEHTTQTGGPCDDASIIENLHNQLMAAQDRETELREKVRLLEEKISKNYLADILRALNMMKQGLEERKNKIEKIDNALAFLETWMDKQQGGIDN